MTFAAFACKWRPPGQAGGCLMYALEAPGFAFSTSPGLTGGPLIKGVTIP